MFCLFRSKLVVARCFIISNMYLNIYIYLILKHWTSRNEKFMELDLDLMPIGTKKTRNLVVSTCSWKQFVTYLPSHEILIDSRNCFRLLFSVRDLDRIWRQKEGTVRNKGIILGKLATKRFVFIIFLCDRKGSKIIMKPK